MLKTELGANSNVQMSITTGSFFQNQPPARRGADRVNPLIGRFRKCEPVSLGLEQGILLGPLKAAKFRGAGQTGAHQVPEAKQTQGQWQD